MRELSPEEMNDMLTRNGVGVLALIDGDYPYAIPMSFGYDGTEVCLPMQWGAGYDGRKIQCIESNSNACFTVYEQDPDDARTWRSVVITGSLERIADDREAQAYASLAANATVPSDLGVWGIPFEELDFELFEIAVDDCVGREFSPDGPRDER